MRALPLPVLLLVLGACAGARVTVPEAERLTPALRGAYQDAVAAWIDDDPVKTRERLEELRRLEPWYVPAHVLHQDASTSPQDLEDQRVWYRREAESRPDDAARVLLDGRLTPREDGRREAAYRRAYTLDPDAPWPGLALAFELDRAARAAFEESVALADQGYVERAEEQRQRAGQLHRESRRIADALVARHPDVADVCAGAAEVFLARGEALGERETLQRALELAEKAADLDPAHPARHALLARVRRSLIDDAGAETALRRALELDEDDPVLLAGLGRVLLDLGRPEEARDVLLRALRTRPEDVEILTDVGVAAQRMGDLDAARERLRRAAELSGADARPLRSLTLVEMERGDRAAARRALRDYLDRGGAEREWARATLEELGDDG